MFTAKSVIYPCSSNPDEIMVTGEDENGRPVNAPIITDVVLAKQLAETPPTIPNPAHASLIAQAFTKAAEHVEASLTLMDQPEIPAPNPSPVSIG